MASGKSSILKSWNQRMKNNDNDDLIKCSVRYQTWRFSGKRREIRVTVFCLSARGSPHGRDDERCRLVAKRSGLVPEAARPEPRAPRATSRHRGVCAHSGRLPYFQL